jgi:hypothetical protein
MRRLHPRDNRTASPAQEEKSEPSKDRFMDHAPEVSDETVESLGELRAVRCGQSSKPVAYGQLATAYVPWQIYNNTLDLRNALCLGTLFPELVRTPPLYQKRA